MCGRFALIANGTQLAQQLRATWLSPEEEQALAPSWNVSPSQQSALILYPRHLALASWGFRGPESSLHINARSESVAEKVTFREAYRSRRALVPLSGWFEWTPGYKVPKGLKTPPQPYWIYAPQRALLVAAALWEPQASASPNPSRRFTILTAEAPASTAHLHPRTPLVLTPQAARTWLNPQTPPEDLEGLLQSPEMVLSHHPVSTAINAAQAQGAQLIEPIRLIPPLL